MSPDVRSILYSQASSSPERESMDCRVIRFLNPVYIQESPRAANARSHVPNVIRSPAPWRDRATEPVT
jgi:hypothetical protein